MTAYELLDIRNQTSDAYMSTMKFWLTVTFAVFGAVNFIRDDISLLGAGLLVVFYGGLSLATGFYCTQLKNEIHAIEDDLCATAETAAADLHIMNSAIIRSRVMSMAFQWACVIGAPIVYAGFLYQILPVGK
ncbi:MULTISPECIES: hypothetical protein [Kordiimonas]|jgi:hypothetical protein|uniref:hypothetical protein n=1 Tax=Kordiimonas TaxID=288021 RepID=UPI00257DB338|nr:hypothetical protein [Kordiimonas sp. UBA4487]